MLNFISLKNRLVNLLTFIPVLLFFVLPVKLCGQESPLKLSSPNGDLKVEIYLCNKLYYSSSINGSELLTKNHLAMELVNGTFGENPKLISSKTSKNEEIIKPYISPKFSTVKSIYNTLLLNFKGVYSVEFRAFDDGIAYRFVTKKKGNIEVVNEDFTINFPKNHSFC